MLSAAALLIPTTKYELKCHSQENISVLVLLEDQTEGRMSVQQVSLWSCR